MSNSRRRSTIEDYPIHGTGNPAVDTAKFKRLRDVVNLRADSGKGSRIVVSGNLAMNEIVSVYSGKTLERNAGGIKILPGSQVTWHGNSQIGFGGYSSYLAGGTPIKTINTEGQEWFELDVPDSLSIKEGDYVNLVADNELTTPHSRHSASGEQRVSEIHRILKRVDGNGSAWVLDGFLKDQLTLNPRVFVVPPMRHLVVEGLVDQRHVESSVQTALNGSTFRGTASTVAAANASSTQTTNPVPDTSHFVYVLTGTTGIYFWDGAGYNNYLANSALDGTSTWSFRRAFGLKIEAAHHRTPVGGTMLFHYCHGVDINDTLLEDKQFPRLASHIALSGYHYTVGVCDVFRITGGDFGHCRHILTTGASASSGLHRYGTSTGTVTGTTTRMSSSPYNSNRPWDTHAEGWGWTFTRNRIFCKRDSQAAAYQTRSRYTKLTYNEMVCPEGQPLVGNGPRLASIGGPNAEAAYNTVVRAGIGGRTWSMSDPANEEGGITNADYCDVHHNMFLDCDGQAWMFQLGTQHRFNNNTAIRCGASPQHGTTKKALVYFDHGSGHIVQSNQLAKYDNDIALDMNNSTPLRNNDITGNNMHGYGSGNSPFNLEPTTGWSYHNTFTKYNQVDMNADATPIGTPGADVTVAAHGLGDPAPVGTMVPRAVSYNPAAGTVTAIDGTDAASAVGFNAYLIGINDADTLRIVLASEAEKLGSQSLASATLKGGHSYYADENGEAIETITLARMFQASTGGGSFHYWHAVDPDGVVEDPGPGGGGGGGTIPTGNPLTNTRIGLNVGRQGFADYAQHFNDSGLALSPYVDTDTPAGTIDPTTGNATAGTVQRTWWCRTGINNPAGDYEVSWPGSGSVDGNASSPYTLTLTNQQSVQLNSVGDVGLVSIKPVGVTDVVNSHASNRLDGFHALRLMNAMRTNEDGGDGGGEYDPAIGYRVRKRVVTGGNTFHHLVPSLTHWAQLAEAAGVTDLWVCFHHRATTANIQAMVTELLATDYVQNGGRVLYEHSNEIWNSDFPQFNYALTQARADSQYDSLGDTVARWRWHVDRTNTIGGIVKALHPEGIVVLGSQNANPIFGSSDNANQGLGLSPNIANIDAIGVAPYFGQQWVNSVPAVSREATITAMTNAQIVDEARTIWEDTVRDYVTTWKGHTDTLGLSLIGYEDGCHLDDPANNANTQAALTAASQSAEMGVLYTETLDWWDTNVGTLITLFEGASNPLDTWSGWAGELGAEQPRITAAKTKAAAV